MDFAGFGRPRRTDEPVRCLNCGETYPERKLTLKHAGRTGRGDFYNSICPECGAVDCMNERYAKLAEEEFQAKRESLGYC